MRHLFLLLAVLGLALGGAASARAASDGAANFAGMCATCHGPDGKGKGPTAAALNPKPRDFTDCNVMKKDTDDVLFKAIKGGGQSVGRSAMMPSWGGALSDAQIHELVSYVRAFCKK